MTGGEQWACRLTSSKRVGKPWSIASSTSCIRTRSIQHWTRGNGAAEQWRTTHRRKRSNGDGENLQRANRRNGETERGRSPVLALLTPRFPDFPTPRFLLR